jgi:nitrate reductase gamma subunit
MVPWLITTWPGLTAHVAGATARLAVDPAIVVGATAGTAACAGAALLWNRTALRRRRASSG